MVFRRKIDLYSIKKAQIFPVLLFRGLEGPFEHISFKTILTQNTALLFFGNSLIRISDAVRSFTASRSSYNTLPFVVSRRSFQCILFFD